MRGEKDRHYTEDELLLHLLDESPADAREAMKAHVGDCPECSAVLMDFRVFREQIARWTLPEVPEEALQARKAALMEAIRQEKAERGRGEPWETAARWVQQAWDYAVNNPLPTLGYVAAAVAFASERTISLFRLDELLPATGEFLDIIRQVF